MPVVGQAPSAQARANPQTLGGHAAARLGPSGHFADRVAVVGKCLRSSRPWAGGPLQSKGITIECFLVEKDTQHLAGLLMFGKHCIQSLEGSRPASGVTEATSNDRPEEERALQGELGAGSFCSMGLAGDTACGERHLCRGCHRGMLLVQELQLGLPMDSRAPARARRLPQMLLGPGREQTQHQGAEWPEPPVSCVVRPDDS